ncbi:G-protein coupled receptor family C group 6 member A-like isoform X2 [Salmo trutta]|uniref:G-protein coupled receptor family C group 6 member A-like isoform X2 n=1 Tax=Salmo trutta TaxID=8032 RepID=UPI001130B56B|nr:G-protein coupled receptor family C group 6 member A-like isoform X2 [Salmo trutta]
MNHSVESANRFPVPTTLGISLRYHIHDSCSDVTTALRASADFTQISYASTAIILSGKIHFPAFLRTVLNNLYQTHAMVRLLSNSNWTWVGMVTTDGDYGRSALDSFVSEATASGICVAFKEILPDSLTSPDINSAVKNARKTIRSNPKVKVVV